MRFLSFLLPGLLMTGGFGIVGCWVSKGGGGGFDFVIMMRSKTKQYIVIGKNS